MNRQTDHSHILPTELYLRVFAILMVLLVATVLVAFLPLGWFGLVLALGIASTKALLIMLYFMHLRYSNPLSILFAVGAFAWLFVLLLFVLGDYLSRSWIGA